MHHNWQLVSGWPSSATIVAAHVQIWIPLFIFKVKAGKNWDEPHSVEGEVNASANYAQSDEDCSLDSADGVNVI